MPRPRVYVETTVPNFYYDFRPSPAVAERREWTRLWWATAAERYELVTSLIVASELSRATSPYAASRIALLGGMTMLPLFSGLEEIVDAYVHNKLMPAKPREDGMHLALASKHQCDFIVTWDCRHLANPNKATHLRRINALLGLHVPELVTPSDMLGRNL
jgi:predicted nucleic acid-binding protein